MVHQNFYFLYFPRLVLKVFPAILRNLKRAVQHRRSRAQVFGSFCYFGLHVHPMREKKMGVKIKWQRWQAQEKILNNMRLVRWTLKAHASPQEGNHPQQSSFQMTDKSNIRQLLWLLLCQATCFKIFCQFSTNEKQYQNQSHLVHMIFHLPWASYRQVISRGADASRDIHWSSIFLIIVIPASLVSVCTICQDSLWFCGDFFANNYNGTNNIIIINN